MPRPPRFIFANHCYHVLNRANFGMNVFHESRDYADFMRLMVKAQERLELPILAACLMPNHFHLVVRPKADNDISRWMQWLCTTHVRHYHERHSTYGRLWQGRYKACIVQDDQYLMTVMRYVERNALAKKLVLNAEDWRWGSLSWRTQGVSPLELSPSPLRLPSDWIDFVNMPLTAIEVEAIRTSVNRQKPFGDPAWVEARARDAGLEQSLVNVGRPRKKRA